METSIIKINKTEQHSSEQNKIEMVDFYNEATEDYQFWSTDFNMHFGYFIPFKTNVLRRDSMLNQMNHQVLKRLKLPQEKALLVDLGCGMGGTMRYALKRHKDLAAFGVTLSNFQVRTGNQLLQHSNGTILKENYNHTSFASESFDGATAIESFCHSGHGKKSFQEAFRILKSGGKLVIADAFLKKDPNELCLGSDYAYQKLCSHWSLEQLGSIESVKELLKEVGFRKVRIEDISLRVAPSVLHVPFAIFGFILKKIFCSEKLKKESLHNLKGSFYALLSGLHMKSFGYYLITCTK